MPDVRTAVYEQFRRPHGPAGRLAGWVMSARASNRARNRWTVDRLALAPDARVLEVGYGPGRGIEAALRTAPRGEVVGLDHSVAMRRAAARRNADAVRSGRARLLIADAQDPPSGLGPFDAVFGCNVWLFWPDQAGTIRRLAALLAPGGRLALTHQPRVGAPQRADTVAAGDRIEEQLREAGLTGVHRAYLELEPVPAVCVIGSAGEPGGQCGGRGRSGCWIR